MPGEWFFSTIAQASAAVVGFIVAITMVIFSLEKERKLNRIAEYRDLLEELFETYITLFDEVQAQFSTKDTEDVDYIEYIFNEYGSESIREDMFTDDFQDHPIPVQFYTLCLHITTTIFHDLRPGMPDVPDQETIESVGNAVLEVNQLLSEDSESSCVLYNSFTDSEDCPEDYMTEAIFDPPIRSEDREIKSLADLKEECSGMLSLYFKIRDRYAAVYSDYTKGAYNILNLSIYLVSVGVFLPLLVLIIPSEFLQHVNQNLIFGIEVVLFGSSSILTFSLIEQVMLAVKSDATRKDSRGPSWLTQKLTHRLPNLI